MSAPYAPLAPEGAYPTQPLMYPGPQVGYQHSSYQAPLQSQYVQVAYPMQQQVGAYPAGQQQFLVYPASGQVVYQVAGHPQLLQSQQVFSSGPRVVYVQAQPAAAPLLGDVCAYCCLASVVLQLMGSCW